MENLNHSTFGTVRRGRITRSPPFAPASRKEICSARDKENDARSGPQVSRTLGFPLPGGGISRWITLFRVFFPLSNQIY